MPSRPLVSLGVTVELSVPGERRVGVPLQFADLPAARTFLAPIAADAFMFAELRRIAASLDPWTPMQEQGEVTARVAAALVERRITFVRVKSIRPSADIYAPRERKDGEGGGEGSEAELVWIEVRLLDEDGGGIANQKCIVVAPDAQRHTLYTDSLGTARANDIPAGSCKILFPDLDVAALPKSETAKPTRAEMRERMTAHELIAGVTRATSEAHELRLVNITLKVRLAIDPNDSKSRDDQFILHALKGSADQQIVKTIKDDKVPGDKTVDLVYEHLWRDHRYTLEVDPGAEGEPYIVFKDTALQQLVSH